MGTSRSRAPQPGLTAIRRGDAIAQQPDLAARGDGPIHFACAGMRRTACGIQILSTDLRCGANTAAGWICVAFGAETTTCPQCLAAAPARQA